MTTNGDAAGLLRSVRDRIVRLEEEKKAIAEDIKGIYAEAKGLGLDTKAVRQVVKRTMETQTDAAKRRETEALTELYLASLGMLDGTPLGDAARERALPPAPAADPDRDSDDDGGAGASPEPAAAVPPAPTRGGVTAQP